MAFEPWMLAAMEDAGYMTTSHGLNMRIAHYLSRTASGEVGEEEFTDACIACGVDPNSITQSDLDDIQHKLNELT